MNIPVLVLIGLGVFVVIVMYANRKKPLKEIQLEVLDNSKEEGVTSTEKIKHAPTLAETLNVPTEQLMQALSDRARQPEDLKTVVDLGTLPTDGDTIAIPVDHLEGVPEKTAEPLKKAAHLMSHALIEWKEAPVTSEKNDSEKKSKKKLTKRSEKRKIKGNKKTKSTKAEKKVQKKVDKKKKKK